MEHYGINMRYLILILLATNVSAHQPPNWPTIGTHSSDVHVHYYSSRGLSSALEVFETVISCGTYTYYDTLLNSQNTVRTVYLKDFVQISGTYNCSAETKFREVANPQLNLGRMYSNIISKDYTGGGIAPPNPPYNISDRGSSGYRQQSAKLFYAGSNPVGHSKLGK